MVSDKKSGSGRDAKFSLGTRDSRQAGPTRGLSLATPQRAEAQGSDPYNTSGSFDRKKNWERVGKR